MKHQNPIREPRVLNRVKALVSQYAFEPGKPGNAEVAAMLLREFQLCVTPGQVAGAMSREGIDRGGPKVRGADYVPAPVARPSDIIPPLGSGDKWPDEDVNLLRELHTNDVPWTKIGERLFRSPSACVQKAHRLGLPERKKGPPFRVGGEVRPAARPRPSVVAPINFPLATPASPRYVAAFEFRVPVPRPLPEPRAKAYIPPSRRCAYPMWADHERPTFKFCDAPVDIRSYCLKHARDCYVNVRDRREDTA